MPTAAPAAAPPAVTPLAAWARTRGLEQSTDELLPPLTPRLRRGLGAGAHRAQAVRRAGGTATSSGPRPQRPERATPELCRGRLPGGLDGVLAHHTHLGDGLGDDEWGAWTETVVVAWLPSGARGVAELTAHPGGGTPAAATTLRLGRRSADPRRTVVPPPVRTESAGGRRLRIAPAEDDATVEALLGDGALAAALAAAPPGAAVEVEDGVLCVAVADTVTAPAALDALCRVAAAVAAAIARAAARRAPLDPATALPAPAPTDRARWVDGGVRTVAWPHPPVGAAEAAAAYAAVARPRALRVGLAVGLLVVVVAAVAAAAVAAAELVVPSAGLPVTGAAAVVLAALAALPVLRAALGTVREVRGDEVAGRARPWALEAWVRGHAAARGLVVEDADALRHALDAPLRGRPVKAMHGVLAGGVPGHLAVWAQPGDGGPVRWHLLAAVAAPAGPVAAPAPYAAAVRGDVLVVTVAVAADDRTSAALDALAGLAARLAGARQER